jgi:hypothetical protein
MYLFLHHEISYTSTTVSHRGSLQQLHPISRSCGDVKARRQSAALTLGKLGQQ